MCVCVCVSQTDRIREGGERERRERESGTCSRGQWQRSAAGQRGSSGDGSDDPAMAEMEPTGVLSQQSLPAVCRHGY